MANVYAVKSGNWSDTTVWNTGALPTASDDVWANTFTITIDISPTVLSIRNSGTTGVTAGGSFVPTNGITLACTATGVIAGPSPVLVSSLITGQSFSIIGNCVGGYSTNANAVSNNSSGIVNITGNVTASSNSSNGCNGANNTAAGAINITGNVTGSNNSTSVGVLNSGNGTVTVTGTITGGTSGYGANNSSGGTGTLTHIGTAQASSSFPAIATLSTGTTILSGPFLTSNTGYSPILCVRWFWANSNVTPTYYQIRTANLATIRPLYTADSVGGNPSASNVRSGTVYGPAGELTGTCAVPPAGSVALGVPVDNTTGTAYLSQSDIAAAATTALTAASAATFNQPITSLTTPNSIGERLKNSATVATVSQQISDVFSSRQ